MRAANVDEPRNRRVKDSLIAMADAGKGLLEAIGAAFPHILVQSYIVNLPRNSLAYVACQGRRQVRGLAQADLASADGGWRYWRSASSRPPVG